ncbi:hypothetical protein AAG906_029244 [Vitis piasezkii]
MDWVEKIIEAIATFVEFPYNLEDHASSTWFAVVSLAVGLCASIMKCTRFHAIHHDGDDVMTMVGLMSAQFSKPLVASKATHLVCLNKERLYTINTLYSTPQIQKVCVCKKLANTFLAVRGAEVRKSGLSYRALRMFWIMQSPSDGCNPNETLNLSVRPDPIAITENMLKQGSIWMDVQVSKFEDKSTAAMSTFGDILWEEEIHWLTTYKSLAMDGSADAAVNPGNSRDPLLDSKGMMSGIDTAILTQTGCLSLSIYKEHHYLIAAGLVNRAADANLYLVQNLVVLVAEYMSGPVGDPVNWDKSMGIKMFDGDSFHSEKNKKSILVDDSFMIQPHMVADIAGVTQPQSDMPEFHRKGLKFFLLKSRMTFTCWMQKLLQFLGFSVRNAHYFRITLFVAAIRSCYSESCLLHENAVCHEDEALFFGDLFSEGDRSVRFTDGCVQASVSVNPTSNYCNMLIQAASEVLGFLKDSVFSLEWHTSVYEDGCKMLSGKHMDILLSILNCQGCYSEDRISDSITEVENIMSAWTKEGAFLGSLVNQLSDVASLPASLCRDDLAIQLLCLNWDDICALFSWILGFSDVVIGVLQHLLAVRITYDIENLRWDFLSNRMQLFLVPSLLQTGIGGYCLKNNNVPGIGPISPDYASSDNEYLTFAEGLISNLLEAGQVAKISRILSSFLNIYLQAYRKAFLSTIDNGQHHGAWFSPLLLLKHTGVDKGIQDGLLEKSGINPCHLESVYGLLSKLDQMVKKRASGFLSKDFLKHVPIYALKDRNRTNIERMAARIAIYSQLCQDDMPMVKRSAASNLGKFAATVEAAHSKADIMSIFEDLTQDDQDSVRLLAVKGCAALGKLLEPQDCVAHILPIIVNFSQDKSWRVRYMVANQLYELCEAVGPEPTRSDLVPAYVQLLCDNEAEVRIAAAGKELSSDSSQHVRSALASVIMGMAPVLGKEMCSSGPEAAPLPVIFIGENLESPNCLWIDIIAYRHPERESSERIRNLAKKNMAKPYSWNLGEGLIPRNSFCPLRFHVGCNVKDEAGAMVQPGDISIIYVRELPEIKGKFNHQRVMSVGLKAGPKYCEL